VSAGDGSGGDEVKTFTSVLFGWVRLAALKSDDRKFKRITRKLNYQQENCLRFVDQTLVIMNSFAIFSVIQNKCIKHIHNLRCTYVPVLQLVWEKSEMYNTAIN